MPALTFIYLIFYALLSFAQIWHDIDKDKPVWQIMLTLTAFAIMCIFVMASANMAIADKIIAMLPYMIIIGLSFELYNLFKDKNDLHQLKPAMVQANKKLQSLSNLIPILYLSYGYGLAFLLYLSAK